MMAELGTRWGLLEVDKSIRRYKQSQTVTHPSRSPISTLSTYPPLNPLPFLIQLNYKKNPKNRIDRVREQHHKIQYNTTHCVSVGRGGRRVVYLYISYSSAQHESWISPLSSNSIQQNTFSTSELLPVLMLILALIRQIYNLDLECGRGDIVYMVLWSTYIHTYPYPHPQTPPLSLSSYTHIYTYTYTYLLIPPYRYLY